ncbi:MAG: HNH endonuclease [Candidatus Paceibacterota bacterium]
MIKIEKSNKPQILEQREVEWTKEYLKEFSETGKVPKNSTNRYGHDDIRSTLTTDSFNKCMYCESNISHISYPNVEHIKPKSKYPDVTYDWDNLGLACQKCNTTKGTKFDEEVPVINPYKDKPSDFLYAFGEAYRPLPGNDRGKWTIKEIGLNRAELIEKRSRRLETIQSLAENYVRAITDGARNMFMQELCIEVESDREYVLFAKAMIKAMRITCYSD